MTKHFRVLSTGEAQQYKYLGRVFQTTNQEKRQPYERLFQ